jgi:hypothetical protein
MFTEKNLRNIKYCITDSDRRIHYTDYGLWTMEGGGGVKVECDEQKIYRFYIYQFTIPASLFFL